MKYPNIISASAGSGKTYTITEEIFDQIDKGKIVPKQLIATTFTIKAADELKARIREKLISEGKTIEANRMNEAVIGTINGVCLQLLKKYAFQAGSSPDLTTLDENDQIVLVREFLGKVITDDFIEIARKLYQLETSFTDSIEPYIYQIESIITRLRVNAIKEENLDEFAERSIKAFLSLYEGTVQKHEDQRAKILQCLKVGIDYAEEKDIQAAGPKKDLQDLKDRYSQISNNTYTWNDWRGLASFKLAKKHLPADFKEEMAATVGNLFNNDLFRKEYAFYIRHCFKYAKQIIGQYQEYKSERGLLDFTDQEASLYKLIRENKEVRKDISKNFKLVVVDEFQDVSPLQLAIFLQLQELVEESTWVGDPKQSIYAFRGADPELMNKALEAVPGKNKRNLKFSYRSTQPLVGFSNAVFSEAFANSNSMLSENIVLEMADKDITKRADNEAEHLGIAVNYWDLLNTGKANQPKHKTLADQLLDQIIGKKEIFDKESLTYRKADYGDVAILCRTNNACRQIGHVFSKLGIPVAVSGDGLMEEPEAIITLALLKLLAFRYDTLAKAEVLLYGYFDGDQSKMINDRLQVKKNEDWQNDNEYIKGLDSIREIKRDYSPSRSIETIVSELDLEELLASWGNLSQRIANVDALVHHAKEYEMTCNRLQTASSIPGFLNWMTRLAKSNEDMLGVQSGNVVQIMTYYASKGLEWPIVLLWNLDDNLRDSFYGVNVICDQETNLSDPLAGRALQLIIKPFHRTSGFQSYDDVVDVSAQKIEAAEKALEEERRLYYVVITRARDYLYFCSNKGNFKISDQFSENNKLNQLPISNGNAGTYNSKIHWNDNPIQVAIDYFDLRNPSENQTEFKIESQHYYDSKSGRVAHKKQKINPSKTEPIEAYIGQTHELYDPIEIDKSTIDKADFGTMIHDLICAYQPKIAGDRNQKMISNYIERFNYRDQVSVDSLEPAIQKFYEFISNEFSIKKIHKELPIQAMDENGRYINGFVDMVLELENSLVIIDHKTLYDKSDKLESYHYKAKTYSGQLKLYADILSASFNKKVESTYIYFIFGGTMMEVTLEKKSPIFSSPIDTIREPSSEYKVTSTKGTFLEMLIRRDAEEE